MTQHASFTGSPDLFVRDADVKRQADKIMVIGTLNLDTLSAIYEKGLKYILEFENVSQPIEIDLSLVTKSNSAGLAVLVGWLREAKKNQKTLRFVGFPDHMWKISRVSSLDKLLPIQRQESS